MHLFRQNAHALFPRLKLRAKGLELNVDRRWNFKRQRRRRHTDNRFLSLVTRLSTTREEPKAKELPAELVLFAKDIAMLLDCFSQFPDFLEEVPEQSLETDLKVRTLQVTVSLKRGLTPKLVLGRLSEKIRRSRILF